MKSANLCGTPFLLSDLPDGEHDLGVLMCLEMYANLSGCVESCHGCQEGDYHTTVGAYWML